MNVTTPFPKASCQLLCGLHDTTSTKCSISYSTDINEVGELSGSLTDEATGNGSMTIGEAITFSLTEPLPPNTLYFYQAVVYTDDQLIKVHGNFTTGNYSEGNL